MINHALRKPQPLAAAFAEASGLIASWEAQTRITPSQPQFSAGPGAARWLAALERARAEGGDRAGRPSGLRSFPALRAASLKGENSASALPWCRPICRINLRRIPGGPGWSLESRAAFVLIVLSRRCIRSRNMSSGSTTCSARPLGRRADRDRTLPGFAIVNTGFFVLGMWCWLALVRRGRPGGLDRGVGLGTDRGRQRLRPYRSRLRRRRLFPGPLHRPSADRRPACG
jgi:hypothetical protein